MKKLASAAILLSIAGLMAGPAIARDWDYVASKRDGTSIAVMNASVHRDGNTASALFRFRRDKAEWFTFASVDCAQLTIAAIRSGATPPAAMPQAAAYRPVTAGSIGVDMAHQLCPSLRTITTAVGPMVVPSAGMNPGTVTSR